MIIKKLNVTCLRAITQAEFNFQLGMNLLVGVNGVGKTTALEALRICLSKVFPDITASKSRKEGFRTSDIKIGTDALDVSCFFEFNRTEFSLIINKKKSSFIENEAGDMRNSVIETPDLEQISPAPLKSLFKKSTKLKTQPICVYYSTTRSLIVDQVLKRSAAFGGQAAAFSDALNEKREFNLRIFAAWYKAQEELGEEEPKLLRHTAVLRDSVKAFLPEFDNLRAVTLDDVQQFVIDKNGTSLFIKQLSDGERGILTLLLDIARRLSQANPESDNPLQEGSGIILIDELDLHLHPKWQRTIVENLISTFPNLQFICATHSPQIIGEVPHEKITIIDNGTYNPASSYGIDSSRILEEVLDSSPRNKKTQFMLTKLYKRIDEEDLVSAKSQLSKLSKILGENDADIIRASTLIHFLETTDKDEKHIKRKRTR